MNPRVAVDAMGSDAGPSVVVAAVLRVLQEDPGLSVDLVGDERVLAPLLQEAGNPCPDRLQLVHAPDTVGMDDSPAQVLRAKSPSSLQLAIGRLAAQQVQACVSGGNTGALVALSHHLLGTLPGVERAALCTSVPTETGRSYFLDVGASITADADRLVQYARMGSALASSLDGRPEPVVGLLNVGVEAGKGTAVVQQADQLLQAAGLNYQGFVEGHDLFSGKADVIVSDGFAGNIALKASEGVARLIAAKLRRRLHRHAVLRFLVAGLACIPLRGLQRELDPDYFNGACLLGVQGIVVKSHGSASATGFAQALRLAAQLARSRFLAGLQSQLPVVSP